MRQFNINWPWQWLLGDSSPGPYAVPNSVQPTLDVAQHDARLQVFNESFTMVAGTNTIVLPGFNRPSSLNPAAFPIPQGIGARRWLSLAVSSDTVLAAGKDIGFRVRVGALAHQFWFIRGVTTFGANVPMGVLRMNTIIGAAGFGSMSLNSSLYAPDPMIIACQPLAQVGGEVISIGGVFIESDNRAQPLPDMGI